MSMLTKKLYIKFILKIINKDKDNIQIVKIIANLFLYITIFHKKITIINHRIRNH
jgi:hypothetical protein